MQSTIDSYYKAVFEQGLFGYALHEIILDHKGRPFDYRFLEANHAFEKLTGLKASVIIGKTVREIIPGIEHAEFDWISTYGKIALDGGRETFEQYSEQLDSWYRVEAFSIKKNQFVTVFIDITSQHKLTEATKAFNHYSFGSVDYQKITDNMREFSGAWFVALNKFDLNGKDFTSVGISGLGGLIERGARLFGYNLLGKKWKYDPVRESKIRKGKITFFKSLEELSGKVITNDLVASLKRSFGIGSVVVVKTVEIDRMVGDFTLIFKKGNALENRWLVESFADMVGMLLGRINAEEALWTSEKHFKSIASNTPDHIFIQDSDLRYTMVVNPLFGISETDMLGKTDLELNLDLDLESIIANKRRVFETGAGVSMEIPFEISPGEFKYYEGSFIPTIDHNGLVDGLIGYFRNITNRKLKEVELQKAIHKAEESERLKSIFLANMSHEIRTPMNGILGFTELLKEPDLSGSERDKYIQIIETSGSRLLAIINDIISLSKIESGHVETSLSETNISEQIEFLHSFFEPEANKKGIELKVVNQLSPMEAIVMTDREKVYAILTNLIKNAIKFTENGSVEVNCMKAGAFIKFSVRDTGIGVPAEFIDRIFERFQQSDVSVQRIYEGVGLGLAISKAYVDLLGGKIWLESELGKGSVFHLTIPS